MEHGPDGIYKWIANYMDHWSKYRVHFLMAQKGAVEVAHGLKTRVLAYFGVPRVLQSDCGHEFNNHQITTILKDWPGKAEIVHRRPRHPQSQGLVERGNRTVEAKLACRFDRDRDRCMVRMATKYSMLVEARNSYNATKLLGQKAPN